MIRVLETATYRGPHYYSATPMIRLRLDLQQLEFWPSHRLPGFIDRLLLALPGLEEHGCSYQAPGGFVRRLREGTWLGHVIEHLALELQARAGIGVTRGKTRSVRGRPGVYDVLYAYEEEAPARAAGRLALLLVDSLLPAELRGIDGLDRVSEPLGEGVETPFDLNAALARLRRIATREMLGPTTRSLVAEARRRGIPVQRLDEHSLVQFGYGVCHRVTRASITGETSQIAVQTAGDKDLTKRLLSRVGLPAPTGAVVRTVDQALEEAARLRPPLVIKPLDGNHGRGVNLDLRSEAEIRWGFEQAAKHGRWVVVEEQFQGKDYRILVVGGKVTAVAERVPAQVVGDGRSTIAQLIETVNADPRRGVGHEQVMTRIVVDDHVREMLSRVGLALDSVPDADRVVVLRATANLSTGGTAIDRTDEIHPENARIARRAALTVGLDVAGIDFVAPDIRRSVRETGGGIVEVNAAPGFRMHLEPSEGQPRDVARAVLAHLYPPGARSRIPIVAVTGTNGKSTVGRMVARIFRERGLTVGLTNTSGVYIDDERLLAADASGPRSARMVLSDPTVEVAVLETARGGLLREGLAFDHCDVGMVLNVTPDHLGLKGIDTLEDLAKVKSIVTESVSRRGVSVLNGDDPMTLRLARHAGGRVAFFTLEGGPEMSSFLQKHVAEGGLLAARERTVRGGDLVIHDGGRRIPVVSADEIPATLSGLAEFNVANALAALLAGHAQGVPVETMARALRGFASSHQDNPGRFNIHDGHGFRVIVDYAHNPAALRAIGAVVEKLRPSAGRVIGVVSIPGDRRDEDIREMGEISAELFDELIFRERPDGRGRASGAVVAMLSEGALAKGFPEDNLHRVLGEEQAVDLALRSAAPGDLVMIFPTSVERIWRQVEAFRPAANALSPPSEDMMGGAVA
ncbi:MULTISPECIES: cyanophycin synthetase [unclassified Caulobacter]|uniref:cyanophycin synthetase n=1 Tax=unclassified Caulobacter TaxID=2648921 RepID=UPI0006FAD3DB|nr:MULTISPECIES: cyanophycin synthetase [unclassified Caulobacter]KQV57299.1 cyanophycin synthetase [Caulobacter sp. Root342]KQV66871.1 cyanophycin synthetase [Caulobacter sp. Root343]